MVRIHQGALVLPTVLSESWEPFLFCVLKLVLKNGAKSQLFRPLSSPKCQTTLCGDESDPS